MLSLQKASPFREISDIDICLSRLTAHSVLKVDPHAEEHFQITGQLTWACSVLSSCVSYLPFQSNIQQPITVQVNNDPWDEHPDWLGYLKDHKICLFEPALQNASILSFAFCHEYGHWLLKNVATRKNWESYLNTVGDLDFGEYKNARQIIEGFCDNFAWFCMNPEFISLRNKRTYEFFSQWIKEDRNGK